MNSSLQKPPANQIAYPARTADYFIEQMDIDIRNSLTPEQLSAFRAALQAAMPQPAPKIVDLRVNIDLIFSRFYVVLFVGKERRKNPRPYVASGIAVFFNKIAAGILLVGLNLSVSLFIFLTAYLVKSALGFNLFSNHLSDYLRQ